MRRRKTYAYNAILLGFLLGLWVGVSKESTFLGILVGLVVAVGGFILIRAIEKAVYKGVDKASEKIGDAINRRKEEKAQTDNPYGGPQVAQFSPPQEQIQTPASAEPGAQPRPAFCTNCGAPVKDSSRFCPNCGSPLGG